MEQVSKKGKQHVFSVTLTTIIPNRFSARLIKEAERGSKPGLDSVLMFEMFFSMVVVRVCIGGSSYTGVRS
jgi:hypothetical protein